MTANELHKSLDKRLQKFVTTGDKIELTKMPVPSIALNRALGGGFGRGRINLIFGAKSSAKTSILLQMIADAQKRGESCAFIDAEQTYDPVWAKRLGVNNDDLLIVQAKTFEDATDVGVQLLEAKIDLLIVDSISSLLPGSFFDKGNIKDSTNTGQMGMVAKDTGRMVNMFNYANHDTCIVLISQIRNKLTSYGAVGTPTGGEAVKYFSSSIVKLTASPSDKEQIKHTVPFGEKTMEIPVGRPINFRVEYSKTSSAGVTGSFNFYYGSDDVGIDSVAEIVDLAVELGYIRVAGAWHYIDGYEKQQGRPATVELIKATPELAAKLTEQVMSNKPVVKSEDTEGMFGDDFE